VSAPLVPSPLDYIGRRRFAFYPAIRNSGPNDWRLGCSSWFEVQAINAQTGCELWIPRPYIGAVSDGSGPLFIVGLRKELDLRDGSLQPRVKRVIEMPLASDPADFEETPSRPGYSGPAAVVAIRLETSKKSPMNKALARFAIGVLLSMLLAGLIGSGPRF
jgi:hypothetical protein